MELSRPPVRCFGIVAVVAVLFCSSGCSFGPAIGLVEGTVTLDGRPLTEGCLVNFVPQTKGADLGGGLTNEDGGFLAVSGELPGLPVGEYRVAILPPLLDPEEEAEVQQKNRSTVIGALISQDKTLLENLVMPQAAVVPRKYWTDATSGLRLTVKRGKNSAIFELTTAD